MAKREAFQILRQHGQTATYAFKVSSLYIEWKPRRFEQAYPYSAEWLGELLGNSQPRPPQAP